MTETKTKTVTTKHVDLESALAAFQAEMPTVSKGKTADTGKYRYKYADIADVTEAVMPLLSKHGLSFTCLPTRVGEDGGYELVGILLHESQSGRLSGSLPLVGRTAQEIGSSLTYMRRYLLGCLTGVVTDDDEDGAVANATTERPRRQPVARAAAGPRGTPDEVRAEVNAAKTQQDIRELWVKFNLDAAPQAFQDEIQQYGLTLPVE